MTCLIFGFQSTHPHGVRPCNTVRYTYCRSSFNPRTHTGCDDILQLEYWINNGFNPRTHTGCDCAMTLRHRTYVVFQSTHPHGVRLHASRHLSEIVSVSIHAPTRGATFPHNRLYAIETVSIHAPTRGATVCKVTYYKSIN